MKFSTKIKSALGLKRIFYKKSSPSTIPSILFSPNEKTLSIKEEGLQINDKPNADLKVISDIPSLQDSPSIPIENLPLDGANSTNSKNVSYGSCVFKM